MPKESGAAINATARKLAVILCQMLTKSRAYLFSEKDMMPDEKRKKLPESEKI